MSEYIFEYHYTAGSFTEAKECKEFPAAVKFAADQFALLQEEGAVDPEMGFFQHLNIVHQRTGYVVGTLNRQQLFAIKFSTQFSTKQLDDDYTQASIVLIMGGVNYIEQARVLLGMLADLSLQQFNLPNGELNIPVTYLNVDDARRDLQYLTEFCKIAQFQLSGDSSRHW